MIEQSQDDLARRVSLVVEEKSYSPLHEHRHENMDLTQYVTQKVKR